MQATLQRDNHIMQQPILKPGCCLHHYDQVCANNEEALSDLYSAEPSGVCLLQPQCKSTATRADCGNGPLAVLPIAAELFAHRADDRIALYLDDT